MRPFEEYFARHNLSIPTAHHAEHGALILRTTDRVLWKNRWVLVTIKWEDHPHHPGQYVIGMNSPVHDGHELGTIFSHWPPIYKKWHEYEDFFLDWVDGLSGVEPVVGTKNVSMTAWEMFVYAYDSWFSKQAMDTKRSLFGSLDKENSLETRYAHYQDVALFLSHHHPAVLRAWKYEVLASVQNYSDWLARLVEDKCKRNTPPSRLEIP
jgi:hypothetical protein